MPGAACLIPGTCFEIEAFPTLIRLGKKYELNLHITGPVKDFTLELDLEKNCVFVFGKAKEGFYRLKIEGSQNGIEVDVVNAPKGFLINANPFKARERLFFSEELDFFLPSVWERLSLGRQKAQDWDLVWRRFDLREILPVIFGLGQKIPFIEAHPLKGTGRLLKEGNFASFCKAAFSKILIPRFLDEEYQGLSPIETVEGNPCFLLQEAASRLRSLFFFQEGTSLFLLPSSQFVSGRMTRIQVADVGELDLEWASRLLRRCVLRATFSRSIVFHLPTPLRSFRVRMSPSQKGFRHEAKNPLAIEAGKTYLIDRFQHGS